MDYLSCSSPEVSPGAAVIGWLHGAETSMMAPSHGCLRGWQLAGSSAGLDGHSTQPLVSPGLFTGRQLGSERQEFGVSVLMGGGKSCLSVLGRAEPRIATISDLGSYRAEPAQAEEKRNSGSPREELKKLWPCLIHQVFC